MTVHDKYKLAFQSTIIVLWYNSFSISELKTITRRDRAKIKHPTSHISCDFLTGSQHELIFEGDTLGQSLVSHILVTTRQVCIMHVSCEGELTIQLIHEHVHCVAMAVYIGYS